MAQANEHAADADAGGWPQEFESAAIALEQAGCDPKPLRGVADLMRHSRLPTLLACGPELRILYNEAFAPVLGDRAAAFGERLCDVWRDHWGALGPAVERALRGEAGEADDPAFVLASARGAQRWFKLSFTRITDDAGATTGLVCMATDTTSHVALERRHALELLLSDHLRTLSAPAEIASRACRLLGHHLCAARVSYVEIGSPSDSVHVLQDWTGGELPSLAGRRLGAREFGTRALAQLRAGRVIRINDFAKDHDGGDTGWDSDFVCVQSHSMLAVPLFRSGRLGAAVQVDDMRPRRWTDEEVALTTELAERTASAVDAANADERRRRAERALHSSAARQAFQLELADLLAPLRDPHAIVEAATALLGRQLGASRVFYADVDDEQGTFWVRTDWTAPGVASAAGALRRLDDFGAAVIEALRKGQAVIVGDVETDARTAPHRAAYGSLEIRAFVLLPLLQAGRLSIVLNVQQARPRTWDQMDVERAADMAQRTWLALDAARAQAALRRERDETAYVLDTIAEGFVLVDRHGRVARINAEGERIAGVAADAALGRKVCEVWPRLRDSALAALYRQVREGASAGAIEFRRPEAGARPAWIEVRAFRGLDGGTAVFYRDIDERKRAEEQLLLADRRKNEFLAMLAHELRNPLAPIAAAAQVLQMPAVGPGQLRTTGEVIARQVDQITRLVNELLDVSRITQGLVQLQWERLALDDVIGQAVEQVQPLASARRHRLDVSVPGPGVWVRGDRQRLVQVLANLLTNAAKYTPQGGRLEVQVDAAEAQVAIAVRDNGIGMTPELIACAFELFTQAEPGARRSHDGLGIGLAVVRGIVELHGGSVSAHSEGLGRGSELVVVLPRAP